MAGKHIAGKGIICLTIPSGGPASVDDVTSSVSIVSKVFILIGADPRAHSVCATDYLL